jgi:hypothetical protein
MLLCCEPTFETWQPDFSSAGLSSPTWTRLRSVGSVLCNSLESVEWGGNPIQVQICDACGFAGCSSGGYVHISALSDLILWTSPQVQDSHEVFDETYPATAIQRFGACGFPAESWKSLREAASKVPDVLSIPRSNGRAIADAWAMGPGRPRGLEQLVPMLRKRLLAADSLGNTEAIHWVDYWLNWFGERADRGIEGVLIQSTSDPIETLYFDGPKAEDWPALAKRGNSYTPVLSPNYVFIPHET